MLAVATATIVSRTIEPRSIYDARLTDEQVKARRAASESFAPGPAVETGASRDVGRRP
jgi:hypothetical protein